MRGRSTRPRLHSDGTALTARACFLVRGHRRQSDFAEAAGLSERTVRRMEESGATLTQALAVAGAELQRGDLGSAVFVLSMIGEKSELAPHWADDVVPRSWRAGR